MNLVYLSSSSSRICGNSRATGESPQKRPPTPLPTGTHLNTGYPELAKSLSVDREHRRTRLRKNEIGPDEWVRPLFAFRIAQELRAVPRHCEDGFTRCQEVSRGRFSGFTICNYLLNTTLFVEYLNIAQTKISRDEESGWKARSLPRERGVVQGG